MSSSTSFGLSANQARLLAMVALLVASALIWSHVLGWFSPTPSDWIVRLIGYALLVGIPAAWILGGFALLQ